MLLFRSLRAGVPGWDNLEQTKRSYHTAVRSGTNEVRFILSYVTTAGKNPRITKPGIFLKSWV